MHFLLYTMEHTLLHWLTRIFWRSHWYPNKKPTDWYEEGSDSKDLILQMPLMEWSRERTSGSTHLPNHTEASGSQGPHSKRNVRLRKLNWPDLSHSSSHLIFLAGDTSLELGRTWHPWHTGLWDSSVYNCLDLWALDFSCFCTGLISSMTLDTGWWQGQCQTHLSFCYI